MKYYICTLALCLLLSIALASPPAAASASTIDLPVATSFRVSGAAKAVDNASGEFSPGPAEIDFTRNEHASYVQLRVPVRNGSRLLSLDDYESGIVFRNNTLLLPLYVAGEKTGALIVATDNLTADSNGYSGMITGLELDGGKISGTRDGHHFSADTSMSLTDLPAGASYRVAFADNASLPGAVAADLEASGLSAAGISPPVEVSASNAAAGNLISFVIVSLGTEGNWTDPYGDDNVTFYRFAGGELSRLRFSVMKSPDGGLVYQAIAPGTGQFAIVATVPRDRSEEMVSANSSDVVLLGGLFAVLVAALAIMIRRVAKR